jgi:glycosyltransferase involved in cell wall biosynthesis
VLDQITPLIITYNEEANLHRTLSKLLWAKKIVIIDSGSKDETLAILASYSQAEVIHHAFSDFATQCDFGLTHISTPWVLSLDADYELSNELVSELQSLKPSEEVAGYRAKFVYRIYGRSLRGSLYPPRVVLHRKHGAIYRNEGHGHRVLVSGTVLPLASHVFHDDRKSLSVWFSSQQRYAQREAKHLLSCNRSELSRIDRLRLIAWPAPLVVALYVLFAKGCLLDGWVGWFYALQRTLVEIMIALEILDSRFRRNL